MAPGSALANAYGFDCKFFFLSLTRGGSDKILSSSNLSWPWDSSLARQSAELEFELELGLALERKFCYQLEFRGGTRVLGLFTYAVGTCGI
jgi:hypothetical protein